jgi:hypothetical protein
VDWKLRLLFKLWIIGFFWIWTLMPDHPWLFALAISAWITAGVILVRQERREAQDRPDSP